MVADHLSRILQIEDLLPIRETFPDELFLQLQGKDPWYTNLVSYLVASELLAYVTKH